MATRDGVVEYSTSPIAQRSSERSIRASWTTGYWGAAAAILGVDLDAILDHRGDDRPGQLAGRGIRLHLGQVTLQDGGRRPQAEVRLEHR